MRPLEHHELRDVARAVTDELDDHVDVAVEEASLGLGQERQRGAEPTYCRKGSGLNGIENGRNC